MESDESSTILRPPPVYVGFRAGFRKPRMWGFVNPTFEPRYTLRDSARKRAPLHTSQSSSLKRYLVPRPLHSRHAPYGELNEKRRGSTSGKENPSYAHM